MRRTDREVRDSSVIRHILSTARILHLGIVDCPFPYVVPLHYGYEMEEDRLVFYLHSALEGRKLTLLKADPHVFVTLETDVMLISGGNEACRYGSEYVSLMAEGMASILTDPAEKCHALSCLMKNQTGRTFDITEKMAESVAVIRVETQHWSCKACRRPVS